MPDDVLQHYSDPNYDPVKAHEYYIQNRKLKGRHSTKGMSETQKEGWSYAQNQLKTKKTAALKKAQTDNTTRQAQLKAKADATRQQIENQIDELVSTLQAQINAAAGTNKIPASATPAQRAFLERQNRALAGESSAKAKTRLAKARSDAQTKLASVGTQLQKALDDARASYAAQKKSITDKYNSDVDTEYNNIKSKVR